MKRLLPFLLALALATGCGASGLRVQVLAATAALGVGVEAKSQIRERRMTDMRGAAAAAHAAGRSMESALAEGRERRASWQCAVDTQRAYMDSVGAWVDAIRLALDSGGDISWETARLFVRPILSAYGALRTCLARIGESWLPPVPVFLSLVPESTQ